METTMTLSQLADLIIVISFFSICATGIAYVIADLISLIVSSIKKGLAKRKEKPEESGHDKTE